MDLQPSVHIPRRHIQEGVWSIRGIAYAIDPDTVCATFGSNTHHVDLMYAATGFRSVSFAVPANVVGREGLGGVILNCFEDNGFLAKETGVFVGREQLKPTPPEIMRASRLLADFTLGLAQEYMPDGFSYHTTAMIEDAAPFAPTEELPYARSWQQYKP